MHPPSAALPSIHPGFFSFPFFVCSLFFWSSHLFQSFNYLTPATLSLISKPLFIYSLMQRILRKLIPQTSPTQSLICSFVFSLTPVSLADIRPLVWPGKTLLLSGLTGGQPWFFPSRRLQSCQKPKCHFAAMMLMTSSNTYSKQL